MLETRLVPWRRASLAPASLPHAFRGLQEEFDRLFEDFWGTAPVATGAEPPLVLSPRVDFAETADAYRISAEMPGLEEDELELAVADGVLALKGERKTEAERKDERYHVRERSYGSFQRSFRLPPTADTGKISARFENGVLTVVVPKLPEAKAETRRIAIAKA